MFARLLSYLCVCMLHMLIINIDCSVSRCRVCWRLLSLLTNCCRPLDDAGDDDAVSTDSLLRDVKWTSLLVVE